MNRPMIESRPKKILAGLVAAGCVAIAVLFLVCGYEQTWRLWNVPVMMPPFADARVITAGAESHALGYDPLVCNPQDPWGRRMNYPRIWQLLFHLNIDQRATVYLGVLLAVLFVSAVFMATGNIDRRTAWLLAGGVFSPSVMFGLERGNIDLLMFFLLALAVVLIRKSKGLAALLVGGAFLLKLYPVFTATVFLRESKRFCLWLGLALLVIALAYGMMMHQELALIRKATPSSVTFSYGIGVAGKRFFCYTPQSVRQAVSYTVAGLMLAVGFVHAGRRAPANDGEAGHLDAFRVGASVYVGTYLLGINWDYRLMFLLFALPQLAAWTGSPRRAVRRMAIVTLVSVVASLWSPLADSLFEHIHRGKDYYMVLDIAAKGVVFFGLNYLLVSSRPFWLAAPYPRPAA